MVIVVLIGLGLITVIEALKNSNTYLQKTRQKIIAINLAREGMEQMINIRNTNRQKRAGEKEETRLKLNPSIDESSDGLQNDLWFGSGNYIILTTTMDNQQYFYASGVNQPLIIDNGIGNTGNLKYSLCETGGKRSGCPGQIPQSTEGYFFRKIEGKGLFKKESSTTGGEPINCPTGEDTNCSTSSAKEFRFCSIVEYIGNGVGKVELCSVLTNFEK
ncbi:hypothetical protein P148_SR1C00001G1008 [candidate division SR1 bacterium RAAC1_SR1_1]|nr:hypothetical protein P148_SR1C00001G1008 [candidate division SR1 bacterium RAAC1_SR1_1]